MQMAIPALDDALRMSKQQLADVGQPDEVVQVGAEVLTTNIQFPAVPDELMIAEPSITTFMIDTVNCSIEPLGDDIHQTSYWTGPIDRLSVLVLDRLEKSGIKIATQAFATGSLTPGNAVNDEPHFDDSLFEPTAGVGAVAVVGSGAGPRVATTPLSGVHLRAGTLVEVSERQRSDFTAGVTESMNVDQNRVALFPQFAQLHSGPGPIVAPMRQLMVFRVNTVPCR